MPRPALPRPGSRLDPDARSFPLVTVSLLMDSKSEFDSIQGFLSGLAGRHLAQWEAMEILIEDARSNPHGRLARLGSPRAIAETRPWRPKTKLP